MLREKHNNIKERLIKAHEEGVCLLPASTAEARRLSGARRRGDLFAPLPQAYVLPELWNQMNPRAQEACKIRTLAKQHPDWVFAGPSAALVHGLSISNNMLGTVHVATTARAHSRSNPKLRRLLVQGDAFEEVGGVRVTSLVRTAFDCMRFATFRDGLVLADSALRVSGMRLGDMLGAFEQLDGRLKNKRRSIDVMHWANGLSESGGESVARAVMIEQGFMLPQLQVEIRDPVEAGRRFRVDFYWQLPSGPVAGELDGRVKYRDEHMTRGRDAVDVLADERLRESRLTGAGVKVMRFSYADVMDTGKFCHLLTSFGVPRGFYVPDVAREGY